MQGLQWLHSWLRLRQVQVQKVQAGNKKNPHEMYSDSLTWKWKRNPVRKLKCSLPRDHAIHFHVSESASLCIPCVLHLSFFAQLLVSNLETRSSLATGRSRADPRQVVVSAPLAPIHHFEAWLGEVPCLVMWPYPRILPRYTALTPAQVSRGSYGKTLAASRPSLVAVEWDRLHHDSPGAKVGAVAERRGRLRPGEGLVNP